VDTPPSETLFNRLFELSPDPQAFIDRNGHFLRLNHAWLLKTGFDPSELVGHDYDEHVAFKDKAALQETFRLVREREKVVRCRTGFRAKGGSQRLFDWQLMGLEGQSPIFVALNDFTTLLKTEQALSDSKENYRLLADCVSEGVVLSEDGVIIEANTAFGAMAWMDADEVIGKNISVLLPPDRRKRLSDDLLEGADEGYEISGVRKNGEVFPLEVRTRYIEHQGRKIRVNLLRDVSDKMRLMERTQEEGKKALERQEKVFQALTQNTRELIAILDQEGKLKYAGTSNKAILGYDASENLGRSLFEIIHPEDAPRQAKKFQELLKKPGATDTAYFRIKHKNGSWHHMEVRAHNLMDEPSVRGVVCNVRDISDMIHAQERLMESERFHRALSENSLDVVFIHDPDGTVKYVSPSVRAVLGREPSELMGQNLFPLLHPDDALFLMEAIKKMGDGEITRTTLEQRMRHKNGMWRHVEMIGQNLLHDPVVEGFVLNLRDVTDRRKAEMALKASEARLRGVFNSSSQVFELVDLNGRLVAFNEVARSIHLKMFGTSLESGGQLIDYVPISFRERFPLFLAEAQKEEVNHRDVLIQDVGSEEHWFDITTHPVKDDSGKLVGVCVAATQVDERKLSEGKLLHVERLAAIGQVTGAIAHEMRNPLSVILALAQEKAEAGDEDAGRIVAQSKRLVRLMEDILDFSRQTVLKKEKLSVTAILQSAIASARKGAKKAADGVTLQWEGTSDDWMLGDRVRLEQVFHNLILNAFQSLAGKGRIVLSCRHEGDHVVVGVEDDGPGMPEADLPRVFEPFFTTKKLGTGLGLSISRKIVEDHGGTLEAIRLEPGGMLFKTTLPALLSAETGSTAQV